MRRLAHISDLHFGRTDPAVVEALVAEINADPPDLVVASGDFTQDARRREFEEAAAFLARLKAPWIGVVGNHDIPPFNLLERFLAPYGRYRRAIHPEIEPLWQDDEIQVVGINTARRMALEWNWSYGRLNPRQIARAERRLADAPESVFRIVVAHHPFLPPPWAPEARTVGRAGEALAAFARAGVGLVLAGHLHRGYARAATPVLTAGDGVAGAIERPPEGTRSRGLLCVQAGSATSTRLRDEPNAYNRITIRDGVAEVEARVWDGKSWVATRESGG